MLNDWMMLSKGRACADVARSREMAAKGYTTTDPGFMIAQGCALGRRYRFWVNAALEGGKHRRHAAVKPRPRDRAHDRRAPSELGNPFF
ncbi:hypothetical protein IG631_15663 [Alternaria alternata]|nr:hypothetical protein IG631_15663 [Alternaria alternata]